MGLTTDHLPQCPYIAMAILQIKQNNNILKQRTCIGTSLVDDLDSDAIDIDDNIPVSWSSSSLMSSSVRSVDEDPSASSTTIVTKFGSKPNAFSCCVRYVAMEAAACFVS